MGKLTDWAQENSQFLKVPDNGKVEVIYKKFAIFDDSRNPGAQKVRYIVEVNGKDKFFESASGKIAVFFDSIEAGDDVTIERNIEHGKVRYSAYLTNVGPGPMPFEDQTRKEEILSRDITDER